MMVSGEVIVDASLHQTGTFRLLLSNQSNPTVRGALRTAGPGTVAIREPDGRTSSGPARVLPVTCDRWKYKGCVDEFVQPQEWTIRAASRKRSPATVSRPGDAAAIACANGDCTANQPRAEALPVLHRSDVHRPSADHTI
jgi:hypothetical protein